MWNLVDIPRGDHFHNYGLIFHASEEQSELERDVEGIMDHKSHLHPNCRTADEALTLLVEERK